MRPEAVLFDLDDTLVDWEGSIDRCVRDLGGDEAADALLRWVREHHWIRRDGVVVHRNTWKLHELAHECWPAALPHLDAAELALAIERFREDLWVGFYPDVVPVLDELADTYRLGVLSNNRHLPSEVQRLRLFDWFEVTVTPPDGVYKPDGRAFAHGCAALGLDAASVVYVGDSVLADVEGAHAAGLVPVWLDRHGDGWPVPPGVHRVTSLRELPAVLASLRSRYSVYQPPSGWISSPVT